MYLEREENVVAILVHLLDSELNKFLQPEKLL